MLSTPGLGRDKIGWFLGQTGQQRKLADGLVQLCYWLFRRRGGMREKDLLGENLGGHSSNVRVAMKNRERPESQCQSTTLNLETPSHSTEAILIFFDRPTITHRQTCHLYRITSKEDPCEHPQI
jgi:hypothetical protein